MREIRFEGWAGQCINQVLNRSVWASPGSERFLHIENNLALTEGQRSVAGRAFPLELARARGIKFDQQKASMIKEDRNVWVFLLKEPPVLHYNVQSLLVHGCAVFSYFKVISLGAVYHFLLLRLV